jgi:HAD superfamily phosphatase (TIGR01668 family)
MIHLLLHTKKFIPSEFHNSVYEIDFDELYKNGKRLILSDLDNTLISYAETVPTKENKVLFKHLEELGFEIILVSNNVPSRIETYCENTHVKGYANARKPLNIGLRRAFHSGKRVYKKEEVVVIGDQLMTDIWGANRMGLYSILVNPIKRKTEKWYTKMNRKIEEKMLVKIQTKYQKEYHRLQLEQRR